MSRQDGSCASCMYLREPPQCFSIIVEDVAFDYFKRISSPILLMLLESIIFLICAELGIRNRILLLFLILYSLFDRIDYIHYLTIRNKEWNNVFVPYFLFNKIYTRQKYPAVSLNFHSPNPDSPKSQLVEGRLDK